jgi:hypothetical protein
MRTLEKNRKSERGGAGVKALLVIAVLLLAAHAGFNYVPVAYEGENFKQEMQTAVVNGLALPPSVKPIDNITARIKKAAKDNDVPADAVMEIKPVGNIVQARVVYSKQVGLLPFGMYNYTYEFDYTAKPAGFLMKEN